MATPGDTEPVDLTSTERLDVTATRWHQRSPTVVVAGGLGIFLLAAIVFAVITVSNDSTQPAGTVRLPVSSVTPGTVLPSRAAPNVSPLPSPVESPTVSPSASAPEVTADQAPPTVTQTVSTENTVTVTPTPPPGPPRGPLSQWFHQLFPHFHPPGQ